MKIIVRKESRRKAYNTSKIKHEADVRYGISPDELLGIIEIMTR